MLCVLLVAVVEIPYSLGYAAPIASSEFNGFLTFEGDFNNYLSYIRQSKEGQWRFHNQFTPEPHGDVFFNLGWLLTGKLAALTGISIERSYRIFGDLLAVVWAASMYRLCSYLFVSIIMRRLVFSMVLLGGGFGWLAYLHIPVIGSVAGRFAPYDTRNGLHPFFSILFSPHWIAAEAIVLLTLCLFLRAERTGFVIDYAKAGLACAALGSLRPFDMLYLFSANILYVLFMAIFKRQYSLSLVWRRLLLTFIPMPLMAYYSWLFSFHPVYRWWGIQNVIPPPPIGSFIFSMGFLSLFFAFSLDKLGGFQRKPSPQVLLASCILAGSVIVFVANPVFKSSGQLFSPFIVPVALLATVDLELPIIALTRRKAWAIPALILFLIINSMTSVILYTNCIYSVLHNREVSPVLGQNRTAKSFLEVYRWLHQNSRPREVVLASGGHCNRIPHYSHNTTFAGYGFNTVDYVNKIKIIETFFNKDTSDSFRRELLREYHVRFLLWSQEEKALGEYRPECSNLFTQRFANDEVIVYEVKEQELQAQSLLSSPVTGTVSSELSGTLPAVSQNSPARLSSETLIPRRVSGRDNGG